MPIDLRIRPDFTGVMRMLLLCGAVGLLVTGCLHRKKEADLFSPLPGVMIADTNAPTATSASTSTNGDVPLSTNSPTASTTGPSTNVPPLARATPKTNVIVTPAEGLAGKVISLNTTGKFVVLSFPLGQMPAFEQRLNIYRRGLKVGEAKVTGPKLDDNIVADIAQGTAEVGDEVRDR
jgi:hypothetical protein